MFKGRMLDLSKHKEGFINSLIKLNLWDLIIKLFCEIIQMYNKNITCSIGLKL
jgi:hypothetical protein